MSDRVKVIRHTDKRIMVDLYAGLGGASESMIQTGWDVLRIDNNSELGFVENMVVKDVRDLHLHPSDNGEVIDLVWASPPCLEFSNAYNAPKPTAWRAGIDFKPDLTLMQEAIRIIDELQPKWWVIENVHGAIKDFEPYLGSPRLIIGPFALWGNFPLFDVDPYFNHKKSDFDKGPSNPLRTNYRSIIPFAISESLRIAIEFQKSILEY